MPERKTYNSGALEAEANEERQSEGIIYDQHDNEDIPPYL
jgi:hypothetical protein